ncbi:MAG: hypothetical protein HMLKMBBP_03492 [Planctomycetes bacterium]|nr:hypothetical protein [Planctomycetota bacterium]
MSISIRVQGPIHNMHKWATPSAERDNKCVDYGGTKCSWEALVEITVALKDGYKATLAGAQRAAATSERGKAIDKKRFDVARLYLVQDIAKEKRWYVDTRPCGAVTERVRDMWLLEGMTNQPKMFEDAPTSFVNWTTVCGGNEGCKLETDWRATLRVVLAVKKSGFYDGDNATRFDIKDSGGSASARGTVARSPGGYDGTKGKPKPRTKDDPESPKDVDWAASIIIGSTPPPNLDTFDKAVELFDVEGEPHGEYSMFPVVVHCGGATSADKKNKRADPTGVGIPAIDNGGLPPPPFTNKSLLEWRKKSKLDGYPQTSGHVSDSGRDGSESRSVGSDGLRNGRRSPFARDLAAAWALSRAKLVRPGHGLLAQRARWLGQERDV